MRDSQFVNPLAHGLGLMDPLDLSIGAPASQSKKSYSIDAGGNRELIISAPRFFRR